MNWQDEAMKLWEAGKSWNEITAAIKEKHFSDLPFNAVRDNKVRNYIRSTDEYKARNSQKHHFEYNPDGTVSSIAFVKLREGQMLTTEEILVLHGLDPDKWEIVRCIDNYWNSQLKGGFLQISYQSKLTAKPKKQALNLKEIDAHFAKLDRTYQTPRIKLEPRGELTAEINIADLHLGKLCWHGDTGENYDHKITKQIFLEIITEICEQLKYIGVKKVVFVWTDDFFNSDNEQKTTTGGTPQDTDIRAKKLFNVGCEMLVTAIELMLEIAPVYTFYKRSNHDEETCYHAIKYLEAWFRREPNVVIDIDAFPRKYLLIGKTLVGYAHGDKENDKGTKEKASRLASLMPIEARELWSQARFYEFHAAHLHSEQMIQEINGVIVRRISSPTAADTYHTKHGYVGQVRKAQTFIYDDERGLMQIINTPVRR